MGGNWSSANASSYNNIDHQQKLLASYNAQQQQQQQQSYNRDRTPFTSADQLLSQHEATLHTYRHETNKNTSYSSSSSSTSSSSSSGEQQTEKSNGDSEGIDSDDELLNYTPFKI